MELSVLGWLRSHEAAPRRHEREIGDGGGHKELEKRLGSTEVAGLAHAELHKSRQPVFGYLPQFAIWSERLALLEGPGLLQYGGLLWVDHNQPTLPEARSHTRRTQGAHVADGGVEAERAARESPALHSDRPS